ncbi:sulfate/molybdate ABC transporter ATP-binding protein [Bacillus alkalicellulosilyticus]|uniref:sulfate/molybdate ABC transporter ATP-binding protein n=1 Tax=Alkalihalobacterium alkalicellulosilyticum TaxID=1912214 RepID=UPI000997037F|nr:ATP-binding cassette domain-containing protein [Bacillus alkalicellulosilyticus]
MLSVNIVKQFKDFTLQLDFLASNEITGLIGPSGSGKSLTLQCIAGLQTPDEGEIRLHNQTFFDSKQKINMKTRHRRVGYVFQQYALFPHLTVAQNISYGLGHLTKQERKKAVKKYLVMMELKGLEDHYPSALSGGQQQRTALARTLITKPDILLLDEPFSALDRSLRIRLAEELLSLVKEHFHGPVLLVTHDIDEAYQLCRSIVLLNQGKKIQAGCKNNVFAQPNSIGAAKLLGCKNLIAIHSIPSQTEIKSEQMIVKVPDLLHTVPSYLGIHPHDIKLGVTVSETENTFSCIVLSQKEALYKTTFTVQSEGLRFEIDVTKEQAKQLEQNKTLFIHLPKEKIFLC